MRPHFDHLVAGTPEAVWAGVGDGWPLLTAPSGADRVLVLAAHPDDETLGAGGLIANLARTSVDVLVVIATDGDASHPHSRTHTPQQLARLRRAEVRAAVHRLGLQSEPVALGLPDGRIEGHRDELLDRLAPLALGRTHLVAPWTGDGHPDHAACGAAVTALATRSPVPQHIWQYPIWVWHWAEPSSNTLPDGVTCRLPLTDADRVAKAVALREHRSQHADLSPAPGDEAILPEPMLAHFRRDFETFVVDASNGRAAP